MLRTPVPARWPNTWPRRWCGPAKNSPTRAGTTEPRPSAGGCSTRPAPAAALAVAAAAARHSSRPRSRRGPRSTGCWPTAARSPRNHVNDPAAARTGSSTRPAPNAVWQIDGARTVLADGRRATVVQVIDDHSRLDIACHAASSENGEAAWAALSAGFARYGHPACVLSDNGTAFSGRRRQWPLVDLERRLAALGITTIVSSIGHPQTCGKNERAHQTLQRWLAARPTPATLTELQNLLETYRQGYNHRRHQSLDGDTPHQRFHTREPARPAGPAPRIAGHLTRTVSETGVISFSGTSIGLGRRHAGTTAEVFWQGDRVTILIDDAVAASLTLDRSVRYQRTTSKPSTMC
ncbi:MULTISPECIES: DDE-type integrase/transposase/recombinase [unclassified Pseudonocardia]|uniref:DDE-type integrase/transposase/recombinase n=1 Tax=unclassified Pseudonocardia TaxID=2619320 RepID=UPI0020169272|nr:MULTISPECIES: DDE-type integrase/transposase/recombinase [unclassified Pseudonocardia]